MRSPFGALFAKNSSNSWKSKKPGSGFEPGFLFKNFNLIS
jgi:hypothetical protein